MKNIWKSTLTFIIIFILILAFLLILRTLEDIFGSHKIDSAGLSGIIAQLETGKIEGDKQFQEQVTRDHKKRKEEWDAIKVTDNSQYPQAKVAIKEGTGLVAALLNANPDAPYNRVEVGEGSDKSKIAIITGYIYTYTYDDLGLKIETAPLYNPYFFEKTEQPIIKRNGNIIYAATEDDMFSWDYIEVFFKDPKKPFEDEIKEKQLPAGCTIGTGIAVDHPISKHIKGFQEIAISSMDGNFAGDENCKPDKQLPSNLMYISFYMDPKKPDRYYKFSYGDCAPGPCSIFGDIEFF